MFNYNIDDYSAYMISHDQISLTYRGQITKEIYQFKFLQFDILEEILFLKQEETAVSLPWAKTIIVNFWNIPKENYTLFNLYGGMKILFDMDIIKDLQEVQFKFFSNEDIQALFKLKWLQSDNSNYFYFEIQEVNQYELTLQWRDPIQNAECSSLELERQLLKRNLTQLLNKMGDYNNIYDQQELFEMILENQYDTIYIYFPSIIKLKMHTKIFEESEEQFRSVELFIHNEWFKERQDNLIAQFEILHSQIQRSMNDYPDEIILDYALIYDEEQINCSQLMSKINSLIIKILLTNNKKIQTILLSLMPLEIHFELDIKRQELNLDINLHHEDPQDIYQEGLIILLQTITTCKLFQSLKVDIQQEDDSNNVKFLLFSFIMMIHEFQQTLIKKGTFTYNNYSLIPRYNSVCSKGAMNYLISEKKSIYQISEKDYLDIQREIGCFIQYLNWYAKDNNSIIISCDMCELSNSSKQFYDQLIQQLIKQNTIFEFGILDNVNRDQKYYERVTQQLLLPLIKYFRQKKRILTTMFMIDRKYQSRMRWETIKEMINYLPNEYQCLLHLQN
ncbi:unnamed protein product [Paramecium primaurelia]|uniref:Uncharacterized protein n=1 Tax=Paramecium primaurelia TaxID=5886 RepID=A0A8S1QJE8_PARPR|nr:unnamed protein product [Paramecium primaurelia]